MKSMMRHTLLVLMAMICCIWPIYGEQGQAVGTLYPAILRTDRGNVYGYINDTGKWIVEPTYDYVYPFSEGKGIVEADGLYGIVDAKGKLILKPTYSSIGTYKEGRATFVDENGMGILNEKGTPVSKNRYDYMSDFSDGLAVVSKSNGTSSRYGYIDTKGEEAIPVQYLSADDFKEGTALVQVGQGNYAIIDKAGKILEALPYNILYGRNEGRIVYTDSSINKSGYIDEAGNVIVPAKYTVAEPFKSGVAVVGTSLDFNGEKGLIDKDGKEIYPTIYNAILNLGEGRVALGEALNNQETLKGNKYALADTTGEAITNFIYYGIADYEKGLTSAYDKKSTYLIDLMGKPVEGFPEIEGSGTLRVDGNVVKADIDYYTFYLSTKGVIVFVPNQVIPLDEKVGIRNEKYKPNINYLVYYPSIEGLGDQGVQQSINDRFERESMHQDVTAQEMLEYTYYSNYTIPFYKDNLLVVDSIGSTYYFGAAHPLPSRIISVVNLQTGQFYKLEDLFEEKSDWEETLTTIMNQQAQEEPIKSQLYSDQEKVALEDEQGFYVDDENLYLYYSPYAIGPYSSGYITFKIPFQQIKDIINIKGSFWEAFHA